MIALGIAYAVGSAVTLGVILGANAWASEMGRKEPFGWGEYCEDGPVILNLCAIAAWPAAIPLVACVYLGRALARRARRREIAAKERQKWLEAPLP